MGILQNLLQGAASLIARKRLQQRTRLTSHISDKTAQDIGLSASALARLRHQWPSASTDQQNLKALASQRSRR